MSDYVHNKAVMYPIDCAALGITDAWDLEEKIPEALKDRWNNKYPYLEIEAMVDYAGNGDCNYYLSLVLGSTYGEDCGDFGRNRTLSLTEQVKYKEIFKQVIPNVDPSKLKYVDYCYYNCCESEDYYIKEDEFNTEI